MSKTSLVKLTYGCNATYATLPENYFSSFEDTLFQRMHVGIKAFPVAIAMQSAAWHQINAFDVTGDLETPTEYEDPQGIKTNNSRKKKKNTQTNTTEGNKKTNKHEYSIFKKQFEICQRVY